MNQINHLKNELSTQQKEAFECAIAWHEYELDSPFVKYEWASFYSFLEKFNLVGGRSRKQSTNPKAVHSLEVFGGSPQCIWLSGCQAKKSTAVRWREPGF